MTRIDFAALNYLSKSNLFSLIPEILPGGRLRGREWVVRNPTRNDRKAGSFSVNVDSGRWGDFATGDRGGDFVSLVAYVNGESQSDAAKRILDRLGVSHV